MPTIHSDSSDCESPSLLQNLSRFEYCKSERVKKTTKGVVYSDSDHSTDAHDALIPNAEESTSTRDATSGEQNSNGHCQDKECQIFAEQDSPVMKMKTSSAKRRIYSDSDGEEPFHNEEKKPCLGDGHEPRSSKETDEIFTDKERCLIILQNYFPTADITAITDVLHKSNWNVELAIDMFRKKEELRLKESYRNGHVSQKTTTNREGASGTTIVLHRRETHELSDEDSNNVAHQSTHAISDSDSDSRIKIISSVPQTSKKASMSSRNKLAVNRSKHRKQRDVAEDSDCEEYAKGESSSDSDDSEIDETMTPSRTTLLELLSEGSVLELASIPGCSKKKADLITQLRPFSGWVDLVTKFQNCKQLSRELLSKAKDVIYMRGVMKKLMKDCEAISLNMEEVMNKLSKDGAEKGYINKQPTLLNDKMTLAPYQLIGLNWLYIMHKQQLNGILADEMGLGKTIQAIAFLTYLQETKERGRHLIIVPSSTLDNWLHEFHLWCPSMNIMCYHGSQDDRKEIRLQLYNEEVDWNVMITTYNMVSGSLEDRNLFRRLHFHYVIFDEAHMLKNMASQRYKNLMRITAKRRLLLTGTPLQNNLVELMSLLIFVMPGMFHDKIEQVKQMFSAVCKMEDDRSRYERERIQHAKRIMKPFVLRRLKSEVLKQLPEKQEETVLCAMSSSQEEKYNVLVQDLSKKVKEENETKGTHTGVGMMMMELRKAANHPLLIRRIFTDDKLRKMSKLMLKEPTHRDASAQLIFEDMQVMSDFELHGLCKLYRSVSTFKLEESNILDSGKFQYLDKHLLKWKENDSRVLLFSQFTMMLDIIEDYMKIRQHKFLRLDGSTPVQERQDLIDKFNEDPSIFIFILSTKAGGLGINLTAANVVVIHDIDFNPYNDKQAEDRCHRVGQTRDVYVNRLISKCTIEEGMSKVAQEKLRLEKDVTMENEDDEEELQCVTTLLKQALGM